MSEQRVNPLLEKIRVPGETFRLPSRGLFYKNGELADDVKDGELHVLPMTTVDELAFKSADKLFSGQAVAEVFARRIPQINDPMKLLSKDVDYLMMCLRLVSYGETLELDLTHTCDGAKEHTYKFGVRGIIQETHELDPTKITKFVCELPNGQHITLKPPAFDDVIRIYQNESKWEDMTNDDIASSIFDNLAGMISAVDDVDDREMIREWLSELKAGWVTLISNEIIKVSDWGVVPSKEATCQDCNEKFEVAVPTNPITFFT